MLEKVDAVDRLPTRFADQIKSLIALPMFKTMRIAQDRGTWRRVVQNDEFYLLIIDMTFSNEEEFL